MTPRTETVAMSTLLCDLSDAAPQVAAQVGAGLVRALGLTPQDRDFLDTVAAGHVETPEQWANRVLGGA